MEPMSEAEVRELLRSSRLAHVGLAEGGHAYVVPIFYAFDGKTIYFHSHPGRKTEMMEATKEACLVVSHAESEDVWASAMAFGRVERVTLEPERVAAMDALSAIPLPPEWGFTSGGEPRRSGEDMYLWKLEPTRLSGRRSDRPLDRDTMDVT